MRLQIGSRGFSRPYASVAMALAIVLAWGLTAIALGQSPFAQQHSNDLLKLGAVDGTVRDTHEWWRLWTSQFLHVHFPHMVFNAACVLWIGWALERIHGSSAMLLLYLLGGGVGQLASVVWYPDFVSSGASQALMALCGGAVALVKAPIPRYAALTFVLIQIGLDLWSASTIKAGHAAGFVVGLIVGTALYWFCNRRNMNSHA